MVAKIPAGRTRYDSAFEHLVHHRGQLYVYLRLLGIEPVFVWTGEPMPVAREQPPRRPSSLR
ncbi:MAG: hypothetical protein HY652_14405 [Acidobacteria bacterium]|nr:hypothetical protein [Acidobacteriota bacterium]